MTKPVYDYRKDGLRFRLYPDGKITASSKDLPERSLHQLDFITGLTGKKFSSLCREAIRVGLLDDMRAEQARISSERGMKRNAGVELYETLIVARDYVQAELESRKRALAGHPHKWEEVEEDLAVIDDALAKARGE